MKHEAYEAMQARLRQVRETLDNIQKTFNPSGPAYPVQIERRLSEEEAGLVDALVGDDPLIHASLDFLRGYWDTDLVLRDEDGPQIRLGGNEVWVFADIKVGDDYGRHDFDVLYAIFRNTGALYRIESDGTVADDPIFVPDGSRYTGPVESHNSHRRF